MKTCQHCGDQFTDNSPTRTALYCSYRCRQKVKQARKVTKRRAAILKRSCKHCGKGIKTFNHLHVFCSRLCRDRFESALRLQTPRICAWCHKEFRGRTMGAKFCSLRCCQENHWAKIRERNAKKVYEKECKNCKKLFTTNESERRYCSKTCRKSKPIYRKSCLQCGSSFKTGGVKRKFCSLLCGHYYRRPLEEARKKQTSNFFQMFAAPAVISETINQKTK